MKSSLGFLPFTRHNSSAGLRRLIKSFKSLSQLFAVYKEEDEKMEMEIGFPTDVQHVAHIGWDGSNSVSLPTMKSWGCAPDFLSLPSLSLMQFEPAMVAQADGPLANGPLRFP